MSTSASSPDQRVTPVGFPRPQRGGEGTRDCSLKVLHVLHSIERSGAEVMLGQAASLFREHGIELHALATGDSVGWYAPALAKAGFALHHLPFEPSSAFLARYFRLVRGGHFDVVHVHTERAFFWYEVVARLAGVPRVLRTVHSVFDFGGRLWLERYLQRRFAKAVLGVCVVAPSPSVQEAEDRIYGVRPLLIPNWTDPARFAPANSGQKRANGRVALGIDGEAIVYVSVGSCQLLKRHEAVIRALAGILATCPGAHYLHVGSGELEVPEQQLVKDLGLSRKVTFVGQRDDIPELLQSSDVFVMPSTREGSPISCLEAMSCALPVIATDAPGLRDLVAEGETGRLVQGGDELARAMAELYDDEHLRDAMGEAGRARVLDEFSVERSVESYLALYGELCRDRRSDLG